MYHPGFLIAELGLAGTLENLERKPMGLDATDTRIQQIGYLLTCIENLPRLTGYSGGTLKFLKSNFFIYICFFRMNDSISGNGIRPLL